VVKLIYLDLKFRFEKVLYLRLIILSVEGDISVDSEIFSVTDFMNLKIKLAYESILEGLSCRGGRGIIDNSRAVMSCPPCRGHGVVAVALTGLVLLPGQTLLLVAVCFRRLLLALSSSP
jgi:hypothetical protein